MRYVNGDVKMQGIVLDEYHAYKTKEKGIFQIPPWEMVLSVGSYLEEKPQI